MTEPDAETAVTDSLPHAVHPMHESWRDKARALLDGLERRGWRVVPIEREDPS